jgi:hypothetical protein
MTPQPPRTPPRLRRPQNRRLTRQILMVAGLLAVAPLAPACTQRNDRVSNAPIGAHDDDASRTEVLTTYRAMMDAQVRSYAAPNPALDVTDLASYVGDPLRGQMLAALGQMQHNGVAYRGKPVLHPKVTAIRRGDPDTATIVDCVDASGWKPVYVRNGSSAAPPEGAKRYPHTLTAQLYQGRWLITKATVDRSRTC